MATAEHTDLASRLDVVESKLAVTDVIHACAYANDRRDMQRLLDCYWPDATAKYGGYEGSAAGFYEFARPIIEGCKFAAHHISNVVVEVDGDRAMAQSYYFAHHRRAAQAGDGEEDAFFEGRYLDLLERRGGVWKIVRRRGLADHSAVMPATTPYADWPAGRHSLPWPDDEGYRIAAAFREGGR
jgi:ketosteroid isomerase-like protein